MNIFDLPKITVECEPGDLADASVRLVKSNDSLNIRLTANASRPRFVTLAWKHGFSDSTLYCGDAWERTYGDSEWRGLDSERVMPWYFLAKDGDVTTAVGVKVQPSSFVGWRVTENEIIAELDVRCGGTGVELRGRELDCATVVSREYDCSPFDALCDFCTVMCPKPLLPEFPVYGGNNWYYAYGQSSREDIFSDAELQAELAEGLENRPFMVIDAGWEQITHSAPWVGRTSFGDMREVADGIRERGCRPGVWVRYLINKEDTVPEEWRLQCPLEREFGMRAPLDPSRPEVLARVAEITRTLRGYGFELIKHDFTTYDIFVNWCGGLKRITRDGWSFCDQTKTSAEIVLALYRTILEAADGALVLGCNTVGHLSAGLVHLSRIGDDTSGREWARTRDYGVNSLAFRIAQHGRFYAADADCVGIIPGKIDWTLNRRWMELLARSGTVFFISCAKGSLTPEQLAETKALYRYASEQTDVLEPLDWLETKLPTKWRLNGKETLEFDWKLGE